MPEKETVDRETELLGKISEAQKRVVLAEKGKAAADREFENANSDLNRTLSTLREYHAKH
jgi:hypothetical protein